MKSDQSSYDRYQRQVILKGFGAQRQQLLQKSKVLMIGAGGLGCAALQYLAAAGVGLIGIIDGDVISLSNLHRQVLYSMHDIGALKATTAKKVLTNLNPEIQVIAYDQYITTTNALDIIADYDIVIDGTDNFASKYLVNDACVLLGKPFIYGAVSQFEGQLAVFNQATNDGDAGVNYRDLFPSPPLNGEIPNCEEAGVLGVLTGIIGNMQANEAIKLITGIGRPLINSLLTYNALTNEVYEVSLFSNAATRLLVPATAADFLQMDYERLCSAETDPFQIDSFTFGQLMKDDDIAIIDVREIGELPAPDFKCTQMPLSQFNVKTELAAGTLICICQSGARSLRAAHLLFEEFGTNKRIYSLKGGLNALAKHSTNSKTMSEKKPKNIFIAGAIEASFIGESVHQHGTKHDIGAHSIFLGQVRGDMIAEKKVTGIEYTAYEEMALEKMHEIRESIFKKYALTCMHVYHSLGTVDTGQVSLFVFTSAPRRRAAIEACEEVVERIKAELPVWGRELFEGDIYQWKENK